MKKTLTPFERAVIREKATEPPHSGLYASHKAKGTYHCKACGEALYSSDSKFDSGCGWPSFDDEISAKVARLPDKDGQRTEIVCQNCGAHLGHVFSGEGFTSKNVRHCVNSVSLVFRPEDDVKLSTAIFASGCFWGTQYYMDRIGGVSHSEVGYIGGHKENPSYEDVCTGKTGHLEAIKIYYDAKVVAYVELARIFFETHDFSQKDGQGPDIGPQYLSAVFVDDEDEKLVVHGLMEELRNMGKEVATCVKPLTPFYKAEDYHQNYYEAKGSLPYCHRYQRIFDR